MLKQGFQSSGLTPTGRPLVGLCNLGYLYQGELNQQSLVGRLAVVDVTLVHELQRLIEEWQLTLPRLLFIAAALLVTDLEQRQCLRVACHQHITHMFSQSLYEQSAVEATVDDVVEQHHDFHRFILKGEVDNLEIIVRIQHVEVFDDFLIRDVTLTEGGGLVKDAKGIAHAAVGFLGNHSQCLAFVLYSLLLCHHFQMLDGAFYRHTLEVVNLTTAQDGRQNLMLLGGSQNKDDVLGGLFQRLKEGVES